MAPQSVSAPRSQQGWPEAGDAPACSANVHTPGSAIAAVPALAGCAADPTLTGRPPTRVRRHASAVVRATPEPRRRLDQCPSSPNASVSADCSATIERASSRGEPEDGRESAGSLPATAVWPSV
jgi:hypothetical protein